LNQYQWTFLDEHGGKHKIRLLHGPRSGHVLLLCDNSIVAIDFRVFDSSSYSFFINEELCEAIIERREGHYIYDFRINRKLDTPLNLKRRKEEKRHLWKGLALILAMICFALLVGFGLKSMNQRHSPSSDRQALSIRGVETTAVVFQEEEIISYSFIANSRPHNFTRRLSSLLTKDTTKQLLALGMPLKNGDEFILKFLPQNPSNHQLFLRRPSDYQRVVYRKRALRRHLDLHPKLDSAQAACQLYQAEYYLKENAIPLFYYQDKPFSSTSPFHRFNKVNFDSLMSFPPYQQAVKGFCEE
jgi:hypothetical protein